MKHISLKFFLILLVCLCYNNVFAQWQSIGTNGLLASNATDQSIAIDKNGTPYVAYRDEANGFKATVKKFNGFSWETIGAGLSVSYASSLSLALDNNMPLVAFIDQGNQSKAVVKKYNGNSWTEVGVTNFPVNYATGITLSIDGNSNAYVAFADKDKENKATVKKFNGDTWVNIGTGNISAHAANSISLTLDFNGKPYIAYADEAIGGQATVKTFNGNQWVHVGLAGFTSHYVTGLSLAIDATGTPYVLYRDEANNYRASVQKFNGNKWVNVGTAGFSVGAVLNNSLAIGANGTPYVAYVDYGNGAIGNKGNLQVQRFVGSHWENVGPTDLYTSNNFDLALTLDTNSFPYMVYSDKESSYNATVKNLAATVPFFTAISDNSGNQQDNITSDQTLTLSGNAVMNATVQVFKEGKLLGQTNADAAGKWTYNYSNTTLEEKDHNFTAVVIANGITTKPSKNYVVTIDATAPQTPELTSINKQKVNLTTMYLNSKASFEGTAEVNARVTLFAGATKLDSALTDSTGNWVISNVTLADNIYAITAIATDAAGNISTASQVASIVIDTKAPAIPTLDLVVTNNIGAQAFKGITTTTNINTSIPTIRGEAEANATIIINVDGQNAATTNADNTGNWVYTFNSPLEEGKRKIKVNALDKAQNSSEESVLLTLLVDITAPVVTGVMEGEIYNTEKRIYFNEGTATLNGNAFNSNTKISNEAKYTLVVTDAAGNITTVNFEIDTTKPEGQVVVNNNASFSNSAMVTLNIAETGGATQMHFLGNNGVWTNWEPFASTKTWDLPKTDGSKTVYVQLRDAAGNNSVSFKDNITLDQRSPTTTISTTSPNTTYATAILVKVRFSEEITGFNVSGVAISNGVISNFAGTSKDYTFTINPIASGTVSVNVLAGVAKDAAGNINLETKQLNINFIAQSAPAVTTNEINSLGTNFALLGGNVTSTGNATVIDRGIVYNKMGTPTIADTRINMGSGQGAFSQNVNNLLSGTYYVRAYATNSKGTSYGNIQTFTILDKIAPIVTGVSEGGLYNIGKKITFNEGTATLNNIAFANGNIVSSEGNYTLVVTDASGNVTNIKFAIDTTKPTGTLVINNNAAVTNTANVILTLTSQGEAVEMRFKNNEAWTSWEPNATTKAWTVSTGNGTKSVSVQFRDAAGNISNSAYDLITLKLSVVTSLIPEMAARKEQDVKEAVASKTIAVYPNPATSKLNIEVSEAGKGETTIQLLDLSGKVAMSQKVITTTNLATVLIVDQLQPGIYILNINTPQGSTSRRVVIK